MAELRLTFLILCIILSGCKGEKSVKPGETSTPENSRELVRKVVAVGVTDTCQQPITFEDGSGLSRDIINELNTMQSEYHFTHEIIPTKRLEDLGKSGRIHIVSFQNILWGWQGMDIGKSMNLMTSKDVFIALAEEGRTEDYFNTFDSRSKIGVMGFHYKFIEDGLSQEEQLKRHSLISVRSEKAVVDMVLSKRGEIGIVSTLTLQYLMKTSPATHARLLISKKFDTAYDRYYIIMNKSPIRSEQLDALLLKMKESGRLKKLFDKYGLEDPALAEK